MNNTTTTNGQKPVYNGIGFEDLVNQAASDLKELKAEIENKPRQSTKWLIPILYIAGIALFAFFMYWVYQKGQQDGKKELLKEQISELESEIEDVTAKKKTDAIIERLASKSSAERAKIIREGVIRDLPVIKDTTREYKHEYLKELAR